MSKAVQPRLKTMLSEGLHLHQEGDLLGAEQAYLAILTHDPQHADALHLLGLLKGRIGLHVEGIRLIEQAISLNPRSSIYHNNLGNLKVKRGDKPGAEESYRRAIAEDSRNADAYLNLGMLLDGLSLHAQAHTCFVASLNINPHSLETHMSMGRLEEANNNSQAALQSYANAIRIDARFTRGHLAVGNLYYRLEQLDKAEQSYRAAIAIDPSFADGYFNLAKLTASKGNLREAVMLYEQSIILAPYDAADAYNNMGVLLSELHLHDDAVAAYRKAVELRLDFDDAFVNMGKELTTFGDEQLGIEMLWKAIRLNPANASAFLQLGATSQKRGLLADAVRFYRQSLEQDSHLRGARRNLGVALSYQGDLEGLQLLEALVHEQPLDPYDHWTWAEHLLLHGNYEQGWEEYEWRMRVETLASQHRNFDKPRWAGEPLDGKAILIYAEQGQGDTLQFVRFAKIAAERGGRVILEVQQSLQRLLKDLSCISQCIAQGDPVPDFSVYAPLMSLPFILKARPETVPPLLLSSMAALTIPASDYKHRLQVGIAWAGNPKHSRDRLRSTRLSQWAALADVEGVDFISLQAGDAASQMEEASHKIRFVATCSTATDFADTAALITQLDLVISVDTAIAHLAGAMGKPVWILLYNFGDWRWGLEQTHTEWYSSARLFRQSDPPDWNRVLLDVAASLRQHRDAQL